MYINLHTHESFSDPEVSGIVNRYPYEMPCTDAAYSIGIHPWKASPEDIERELSVVKAYISEPACLAVGECGLDKRIDLPLHVQQQVFCRQLELAEKYQKPVIIHCVAAFGELISIKKDMKITVPMVIHGYSKGSQLAAQLIAQGFYLSFGKSLINNPEMKEVIGTVPSDRFFLETDNAGIDIRTVYERAGEYRNISLSELKTNIAGNFNFVFGGQSRNI